ncbi:histidinol-phosphate transaminase [Paenibacillus sp. YYML68]|uniref:histidinol-phosphate transaminase n=1 Tax=Paenibacillus sp. YYML68 TaxID=2909250 RepID=UPI0024906D0B|nr:histidinol-phosphate transaminase [Paenibacillus sp. YYML68]
MRRIMETTEKVRIAGRAQPNGCEAEGAAGTALQGQLHEQVEAEPQSGIRPRRVLDRLTPYSAGKPIWEVQQELGLKRVVKLASNENPLGPSPMAIAAMQDALGELHRYPDTRANRLRATLSDVWMLRPEQMIVTNGGDELVTLLSETFLEPGDEVIVPAPTFSEYEFGAHLMDAAVVTVPLSESFRYSASELLAAVTPRTKLVWLCSPNNPTGTYIPKPELERLLAELPPRVLLVYDSAYCHFASADDYTSGLEYVRQGRSILVLQTFSKAYGLAGIRVGFGAAPESIIRRMMQVKEPFNVNALAQTAAEAAVRDWMHVARTVEHNALGREQLYAAFDRQGLPYTRSMANFVLVELGERAEELYQALMARGVIVRYGGAWGLPSHIRVSVGTEEENAFFIESLEAVRTETEAGCNSTQ